MMKQSSIIRLAFFYLVLLVSHEGITVASNIRQTIGLQKGAELSSSLTNMVKMMENVDVDSFLEVEDMHGMSAEAYGTMEMIEMHKSLKEGFSFEHSPILKDLKSLKDIPENKVLSPSELKQHREDVSVLLEKAMSSSSMGVFGKTMEGLEKTSTKTSSSLGSCKRTTFFSCGKHSDCRPDKDDPCKGKCICETDGINECKCVAKGTIAKQKLKNLDTGKALAHTKEIDKALAHTKEIDKALTVKGAIGAALFGFVDGFLSGMASEFRDAFEDSKCHGGNVHQKLKHVIHKLKHMWSHMKKVHKKVLTSEGRKAIIHAVKEFIVSLVELLKEGLKYMWQCPATKMLVLMVGMMAVILIMNIAIIATGFVVIPLIVKYVGMIMGLYFSFKYMKDKVVSLYQGTKKMIAKKCHGTCKKKMIEDSFGMVGAITEIVVLSGLDKVLKIKVDKAKPFFKRFGIKFHAEFTYDMRVLGNAAKRCKKGLVAKFKFKSKAGDVLPEGTAKGTAKGNAKRNAKGQPNPDWKDGLGADGNGRLDSIKEGWREYNNAIKIGRVVRRISIIQNKLSEVLYMCESEHDNNDPDIQDHCNRFIGIKNDCNRIYWKMSVLFNVLENVGSIFRKKDKEASNAVTNCGSRMTKLYSEVIESEKVLESFRKHVKNIKALSKDGETKLEELRNCGENPYKFDEYRIAFKNETNIDIGSWLWGPWIACQINKLGFIKAWSQCCTVRQLYDFEKESLHQRVNELKGNKETLIEKLDQDILEVKHYANELMHNNNNRHRHNRDVGGASSNLNDVDSGANDDSGE